MNEHVAARLNELVEDYYHGLLTFESYREQRGRFLDELDTAAVEAPEVAATSGFRARYAIAAVILIILGAGIFVALR